MRKKKLIYLISPITFAPTVCSSHRSFIPIQRSKNQKSKTETPRITNPFSSIFIYKKRDERKTKKKKKKKNKKQRRETKEIKIKIRPSQLQTALLIGNYD
jgi:hypothetical protein